MTDYEKLGVFYLGRQLDRATGQTTDPLLYDSRDLTTHAVCVGMTGSGKTGLCLALLEEAAIDGIPALVIDPKGDLGNLLLTFPELSAAQFLPWVDPAEAARKNLTPEQLAAKTAQTWREGLAEWAQEPERIARFRDAADIAIYTPGSTAGLPLSVLKSLTPPPEAAQADAAARREGVGSVVSGLLALLGIAADPLKSREHILLSGILEEAWADGRSLDLAGMIGAVQRPPFDKVGVFDLESFYPAKERMELALALNALIASPAFSTWTQGEPLDMQRLLFTAAGKPRISIVSIAHLGDAERMFCVTLLLNEMVGWMRRQSGTSSLRAILYMDEIFGYFPPTGAPPAKLPMLTLLKQARAFGVGVVLATQNPVDLDYKGLGNTGTWFIGRLQTERDKLRVLEGLRSALGGAAGSEQESLEELLSSLQSREFLMRNVHDEAPTVLRTRWVLSYLRGPLTLVEIGRLMQSRREAASAGTAGSVEQTPRGTPATRAATPPAVGGDITQYFLRAAGSGPVEYRPRVAAFARLHFVDAKAGVDVWQQTAYVAPLADTGEADWGAATQFENLKAHCDAAPEAATGFAELPAPMLRGASYTAWGKSLTTWLQQHARLDLRLCAAPRLASQPGETEGDFRSRIAHALRERRDSEVTALRSKFAQRLQSLQDQIRRAQDRIAREQAQYSQQKLQSAISIGATVLGAIFGGGRKLGAGNIGRAASAARSTGRLGREQGDVARAEDSLEVLQQRLTQLTAECETQVAAIHAATDPQSVPLEPLQLGARRSDITIGTVALLWMPWRTGVDGFPAPAYEDGAPPN